MKKKQLNLTNTLVKFDSQFIQNLSEILPNESNDSDDMRNNIFNKEIEYFIKKYGENSYLSIDDLLDATKPTSYFKDDSESSLSDVISSLFPK